MENLKETEKETNEKFDIKTLNETILKLSNEINELKQFNLKNQNQNQNQNQNSNNKKEDINEKIDKEREQKKLEKEKEERYKKEYDFMKYKLNDLAKSEILGEDVKDILKEINIRHYDSDGEKNKEIKKTILNRVLKDENKLSYLGETARNKIKIFSTLTDREQLDKAGDYFDYIDFIEDSYKETKRREELKNINGNYNTTSNYFKKFDELLAKRNQNK